MVNVRGILCAAGAALAAASAAYADVPWSNPNGATSFFNWSNGGSANGTFGSPVIAGDTFLFFPQAFTAQSSNGAPGSIGDTLSVDLEALAGYKFTSIVIQVFGDYSIVNEGTVSASGQLGVDDNLIARSTSAAMLTNPGFPVGFGLNQQWNGAAMLDLASSEGGVPWSDIHLSFGANLIATSGPGGSSIITLTGTSGAIAVTIVPAPAAAALLGLAGAVAGRRRRA